MTDAKEKIKALKREIAMIDIACTSASLGYIAFWGYVLYRGW